MTRAVENTEQLQIQASKLSKIFKQRFLLTDADVEEIIKNILSSCNGVLAETLVQKYLNFCQLETLETDEDNLRKLAKAAITATYDCFLQVNDVSLRTFLDMLAEAKLKGIEPIRLVNKTNFAHATKDSLNSAIVALTQTQYIGINNSTIELFDQDEIKTLFEECATLASGVSQVRLQKVLDVIGEFAYDRDSGGYIIHPVHFLRRCKSLITAPPKSIERAANFLLARFTPSPMSRSELIERVATSPSLLLCNPQTIQNFEVDMLAALQDIIDTHHIKKPANYAEEKVKSISDINKFTQITKINPQKIAAIKGVLIRHIGAENALECLTDFNVLYMDVRVLDCLLAMVSKQDMEALAGGKSSISKLQYLLQNTNTTIEGSQPTSGSGSSKPGSDLLPKIARTTTSRKIDPKQFTHIATDVADSMYNNLTSQGRSQIDGILSNLDSRIRQTKTYKCIFTKEEEEEFAKLVAQEQAENARKAQQEKQEAARQRELKREYYKAKHEQEVAEREAKLRLANQEAAKRKAEEDKFNAEFDALLALEEAEKAAKEQQNQNQSAPEESAAATPQPDEQAEEAFTIDDITKIINDVNQEMDEADRKKDDETLIEIKQQGLAQLAFIDKEKALYSARENLKVPKGELREIVKNLTTLQTKGLTEVGKTEFSILLHMGLQVLDCCVNTKKVNKEKMPTYLTAQNKQYLQICRDFYVQFNKIMDCIKTENVPEFIKALHTIKGDYDLISTMLTNTFNKLSLETLTDFGLGYMVEEIAQGKTTKEQYGRKLTPIVLDCIWAGAINYMICNAEAVPLMLTTAASECGLIDKPIAASDILPTERIKKYFSQIAPSADLSIAYAMIFEAVENVFTELIPDQYVKQVYEDTRAIGSLVKGFGDYFCYDENGYFVGTKNSCVYRPAKVDNQLMEKLHIKPFVLGEITVAGTAYLQELIYDAKVDTQYFYGDAEKHNPEQPFGLIK